jgi:putative transposase
MILAYRQKLRPTAAQHRLLAERLKCQRELYNAALKERRDAWRLRPKAVTRLDQQRSLALVRADDPGGHGTDPVNLGASTREIVRYPFRRQQARVTCARRWAVPH